MDEQFRISHETMGASSYMTVTCPPEVDLVHYQLEMMLANDIKKFLPVSRQTIDGEMIIYYNITSKIALARILEKRKLTRKELLCLLEGAILAIRDAAEFRLPEEGIVMDPELIFVNPASCDPAFLFLPVPDVGGQGLKGLLSELILGDRIEMANDNLVQVLLRELNNQPFSVDNLEKSLKPYSGAASGLQNQSAGKKKQASPNPLYQQPAEQQRANPAPAYSEAAVVSKQRTEKQGLDEENTGRRPEVPDSGKTGKKPTLKEKKTKKKAENIAENGTADKEFDPEKAKKMFLLPQALFMVIIAAGVSFGLFIGENGEPAVDVILAFAIVLVLIEVILYREIYVNSKNKKDRKETKKKAVKAKAPANSSRPVPPKPQSSMKPPVPAVPAAEENPPARPGVSQPSQSLWQSAQPASPQPVQPLSMQPGQSASSQPMQSLWQSAQPAFAQQQGAFAYSTGAEAEPADGGEETEIWGGSLDSGMPAYLEYYENGRLNRIPVDPFQGILVGRLKEQVDFAVKSPRVGKIHARFFCQNGQYFVMDINSKNGTYINGNTARIESNTPYPLHDRDRIMLADCEFTIRCAEG